MRIKLLLATTALLASPVAVAQDFYVSAGLGLSIFDDTAETSRPAPPQPDQTVVAAPLDGQRFDSNESMYELAVGWQVRDWVAVELGYADLGNAGQDALVPPVLGSPAVVFTPQITPVPPPLSGVGGFSQVISPDFFASAVGVEEWSLSAKFRKPLVSSLSANWMVGLTRAEFEAEGSYTIGRIISFNPTVIADRTFVYETPSSEFGYRYGFGFEWAFNDRFAVDLGYRRHDTRVIDVETFQLRVVVSL